MSFATAWRAFWKVLGDKDTATKVGQIINAKDDEGRADHDSALQLLVALQREGRFVDFLQEDISAFSDAQVGAVAKDLHRGCKEVFARYLELEPVTSEKEGENLELKEDYKKQDYHLVGRVEGHPPFHGTLRHHGWKLVGSRLPAEVDPQLITPAEVEL